MTRLRSLVWQCLFTAGLSLSIATGCTLGVSDNGDQVTSGEDDDEGGDADDGAEGGDQPAMSCDCEQMLAECEVEMAGGDEEEGRDQHRQHEQVKNNPVHLRVLPGPRAVAGRRARRASGTRRRAPRARPA